VLIITAGSSTSTDHAAQSITSVHSRFRDIGKRLLFQFAKPLTASNFRARLATAHTIGGLVRKITINIKDLGHSLDGPFSTIIGNLKQLEDLTLIHDKDDGQARPELVTSLCSLGSMAKLRVEEAGVVGAPVASFRCSCLVFPLYLIFTCYIARYLCAGQEEGRASRFFLLLTCTRYVLYNTFLPPLDLH